MKLVVTLMVGAVISAGTTDALGCWRIFRRCRPRCPSTQDHQAEAAPDPRFGGTYIRIYHDSQEPIKLSVQLKTRDGTILKIPEQQYSQGEVVEYFRPDRIEAIRYEGRLYQRIAITGILKDNTVLQWGYGTMPSGETYIAGLPTPTRTYWQNGLQYILLTQSLTTVIREPVRMAATAESANCSTCKPRCRLRLQILRRLFSRRCR